MTGFFDIGLRPARDEAARGRDEVREFTMAILVKIRIARVFCPQLSPQKSRKTSLQTACHFAGLAASNGFTPDKIPFPPRQHRLIIL